MPLAQLDCHNRFTVTESSARLFKVQSCSGHFSNKYGWKLQENFFDKEKTTTKLTSMTIQIEGIKSNQ